jgi:Na+-translocating ferredoxin:NAD+ oxidoreductase RnfG subunit
MAMSPNLTEIEGLTIMKQEETPGLGSRIAEEPYLAAFVGKLFSPSLELVSPGKGGGTSQIDSISGATMSSKAFVNILNSEQKRYLELLGGNR